MLTTHRSELPERIVEALTQVCGAGPVPLHAPRFSGSEWRYVKQCIDTTFVSSVGEYVDRFEIELAEYTGAKHAIAVVNGTAALHVALQLGGVQPGDEVLVPALTFVATANAVHYCGAVPHFVDSDEATLGLDPRALESWLSHCCELRSGNCVNKFTGRAVRAVVPMHTFGHPCDVAGVKKVADRFGLVLIEDAAESLGSSRSGRHTGTVGAMGVLSFNGNKIITTGGGGAILTNDPSLARHAKHLTTTAKRSHSWEFAHDEIGYNYRMPNINAALGCAQLEQLHGFLQSKRRLHDSYRSAFAPIDNVKLVSEPANCESNYWLQSILLDEAVCGCRDAVLKATNDAGLMTRPAWILMHRLAPFKGCPRAPLPIAETLARRLINIPSSAGLA